MNKKIQWVVLIIIAVLAFLSNPHGPLGGFWPPDSMEPTPTGAELPLFLTLNVLEALTFAGALVLLI